MMSRKYITIFLFYLTIKMCVCSFQGYVDFDITREKNIQRFPWMVTISNSSNEETKFAYGTLIHKRAVLTLSIMENDVANYFNFQIFAECYFPEHVTSYHCSKVRNVNEYIIIKQFEDDTDGNPAILILSEPFELNEGVNVIHFARHDTDFRHDKCAIMSLRNLESSHGLQLKARLMTSTRVDIITNPDHYMEYKLKLKYDNLTLYDDRDQPENLNNETDTKLSDFSGGPVVCRSTHVQDSWLLVGILNYAVIVRNRQIEYTTSDEVIRVDVSDKHELFTEIIRRSWPSEDIDHPKLEIG